MATAGNGPSTGIDPPASAPGSFLHPSARPLGSSAAQPLCQWPASLPLYLCPAQGGFPGSAQGCKSAPQARQSRKMSPCQAQELGLVPDTQPSHGGQGCQSAGTRTGDPWHSGLWPAWGPLPSTDSPAGYNLLLHIPAVLSRCAGTATPSLVAPSQAEPSGAALRTAPETLQHNPMPQTQSECGDLSSGPSSSPSWSGQSSQAHMTHRVTSSLEELLQRHTVMTPSPARPAPFCWHWTSGGLDQLALDQHHLHHPPGSALRCGSLLGTDQLPRFFCLISFRGCPDGVPMSPRLLLPSHVLPVSPRAGGWRVLERFCMRQLPLSQRQARTPSEATQRSHGIETTGHSSMPGCVTQRDGAR